MLMRNKAITIFFPFRHSGKSYCDKPIILHLIVMQFHCLVVSVKVEIMPEKTLTKNACWALGVLHNDSILNAKSCRVQDSF